DLARPLVDAGGERRAAVAAALASQEARRRSARVLSTIPSGWRNVPSQLQRVDYQGEHGEVEIRYGFRRDGTLDVESFERARLLDSASALIGLDLDSHLGWYRVARYGDEIYVDGPDGPVHLIEMPRFPPAPEAEEEAGSLAAPMPGSIVRVEVSEG